MADYRKMWEELGMDVETHDQLCAVLPQAFGDVYLSQENRPEVIDKTSSGKYVYLRRNFQRITRTNENSGAVVLWQYEEAKVTQEEYAQYDTVVMEIVQAELDSMASEQAEHNAAMLANIEYIAMMADIDLEG